MISEPSDTTLGGSCCDGSSEEEEERRIVVGLLNMIHVAEVEQVLKRTPAVAIPGRCDNLRMPVTGPDAYTVRCDSKNPSPSSSSISCTARKEGI